MRMIDREASSALSFGLRNWMAGLFALALASAASLPATAAGPDSVADIAERLAPAVVNISTTQKIAGKEAVQMPDLPPGSPFREFFEEFFDRQQKGGDNQPRDVSSLGSGFVIDPKGIIVTNNHVIDQADEIQAIFPDGTKLKAELVGRDLKTDLAVLKVTSEKPLPFVEFGDSNRVRVGDWVMAIGNPFGLGGSVTLGIVSARNRNIRITPGPYDDFIQTDAAINRGNSGGPLFDMEGRVVGINTAIISPTGTSIGIGFAIPAVTARAVVDQLVQFGETRRGWLGVKIQAITDDLVESLGLDKARGALVADVTATGPAEKAGIKPGDVVVKFDEKEVREMRDLPRVVADTPVGKKVTVEVLRKGQSMRFDVEVGRLEEGEKLAAAPAPATETAPETAVLGMKLSPITDELRARFKIAAETTGAVVTEVDPGSVAAEKRIEAGDVIAEAGEVQVGGPADIEKRVKELEAEGRGSILLLVLKAARNGDPHFIAVRLSKG